ncbi:MAG: tetratricopeptide repeat protein [Bacteroidales bacterium]|jgi:tetratricopeptide (TPR) repeat protein|nr:tetratricopeptide repeat protein [Bacteroidales bacterium]
MKKITLFLAALAIIFSANAQTMKVQSAYADMKNDRLANAKKNIDAACLNENTSKDAKTWSFAGLIYAKLVEISKSDEKLFKKQKITIPVDSLAETAAEALVKSMEIEKQEKTTEYTSANTNALNFILGYQIDIALNTFNSGKYAESIPLFEKILQRSKIALNKEVELKSMFCIAMAYDATKQKDKASELYRELVRKNTKEEAVYINLFIANKQAKDTIKAINVLKAGVKNLPKNYTILGLLSGAYMEAGNKVEADKCIEKLKAMADTITNNKSDVLVIIGDVLRDANNSEEAVKMYNQVLTINPDDQKANYSMGVLYFNQGVDFSDKANSLPVDAFEEYDKINKQSKESLAAAIPYFEKVLINKPKDIGSLNALKVIFARLEMTEKYNAINAVLDTLKK